MADTSPEKENGSKEERLKLAKERFEFSKEAEREIRKAHLDDTKFRAGDQWPEDVRREREDDGRPCHQVNRMPQQVRQITNDQRQNRSSIKVHPVDDKADVDTAKIKQGMIRHIEYDSNADVAYDTAFDGAVTGGYGYLRAVTEYADPMGFEQEIKIKQIENPLTVYCDPTFQEPDGSDMEYCFIVEDMTKREYKKKYPNSELASLDDFKSLGDESPDWLSEDHVRVSEYYYKEYEEQEIVLLSDGAVILAKDYKKPNRIQQLLGLGVEEVDRRTTLVPSVKWCKINAVEVLEEADIIGPWIPVIPVLGEKLVVEGKRIYESAIRHAKDAQRMLNYMKSSQTETIALAPRAPWVGYEGQFKGHESKWKTAHKKNHAFLEVTPTSIGGQPAPFPQRQAFEPPIQAITMATAGAEEDIKATTGIYDAALGARSNEVSGRAINARNQQAQTSNFHFVDNLTRSKRHLGRILVYWIPFVYDTARAVRIIGEDDEPEVVKINQYFEQAREQKIYRMGYGKYDVVVDVGPSYATKRQEAADSMLQMSKANPQVMGVAGDIIVKNMDWPGAHEIADRLKKALPPGIVEDKDKKPLPPEVQAQMQQMNQLIERLTQEVSSQAETINTKRMELESKERIENMKTQANIEIEMAKLGSAEGLELLRQEVAQIEQRLSILNQNSPLSGNGSAEPMPPTGGQSPGIPMEGMP